MNTEGMNLIESGTIRERVEELIKVAISFHKEPLEDMFVSETRDGEGRQVVESVWVFTKTLAGEFKNPLQEENFDAVPLRLLSYLEVAKKDFDFAAGSPLESSRMSVTVMFQRPEVIGMFRASRTNCVQLLR